MFILGISCYFHDAAAVLLRDGQLVSAAEEERFSRLKHDHGFPLHAISFCLKEAGIDAQELDYVVFYEKPFVKFERILMASLQMVPHSAKLFHDAMTNWMSDKLWIKTTIQERLGVNKEKILFCDHHLSHASSAFLCSPFEDAAILTVDGVGEWTTTSCAVGKGNQISFLQEMRFPHSLGLLYSTFTAYLGFEVNEGEYKVMGMAPYGKPNYVNKVKKLIHLSDDGSFWLDMDYFSYHYSPERMYSDKFERLFGKPRNPKSHFFTTSSGYPGYFGKKPSDYYELAKQNQYYADIAASIQVVTEEILLKMAKHLYSETHMRKLCMAGGVALNSVANGRIFRETPFEEVYIQPAAGDGGGALGAALWVYHSVLGRPRQFVMEHAYWGEEHSEESIQKFLVSCGLRYDHVGDDEKLIVRVVEALQEGKVVGWFQGKAEWGPRALGNRSILADPRRVDMKDIVNTKIKFREPYRPFAPSVLANTAESFFSLSQAATQYPSRFMLYVADVQQSERGVLPAVTHVDGTARLQTVHELDNPLYYDLIKTFGDATGVPVILNTSFNLKGEPIVNSPADALKTFSKSEMDMLVLGQFIINR